MPVERTGRWRSWGPELALAAVASLAFLGFLGSTELWGKREQRAAAEAVDTVAHGHWLVGQIQGRPRLEKPPLPRWVAATLMTVTGRRDEVAVRLPNALAAVCLVALVYAWGRSVGGRAVGLAAGFALASTAAFVVEMRQAGNDGFLTLFVALALAAAAKRWGIGPEGGETSGPRGWARLCAAAIGLGFLCKGPVVFLWVGVPVGRLPGGPTAVHSGAPAPARPGGAADPGGPGAGLAGGGRAPVSGGLGRLVARNGPEDGGDGDRARQRPGVDPRGSPRDDAPLDPARAGGAGRPGPPPAVAARRGRPSSPTRPPWASPGGGRSPPWRSWGRGTSPSRTITSPPSPPWRSWPAPGGSPWPAAPATWRPGPRPA